MSVSINVIDLDKTLIPYDSFRDLSIIEIKKWNIRIILLTLLRISRFISLEVYKKNVFKIFVRKYDDRYFFNFAKKLYKDIDPRVLRIINELKKDDSINILLSASPDFYVKHLLNELKWVGSGSYFDKSGNFIHLYGRQKIEWLMENYDSSHCKYHFAISDSVTDNDLLELFQERVLWNPNI